MKYIKSYIKILNWQNLVIMILSLAATYFCRRYGIVAKFPLTLVGIAVIFPLVFSINSAYKRRETALAHYAILKGNGRAIFFASQDWIENPSIEKREELKAAIEKLFTTINFYLHSEDEALVDSEDEVLKAFRGMSLAIKGFRAQGMSGSEVSRNNQYLSKMMVSFEHLKHIYQYRTPLTLRAYSKIFIYIIPVLYGPYFAEVTQNNILPIAFILPVLFSVLLVSLDNIQDHLEDPFDNKGEDDVYVNSKKFVERLK